MGKLESAVRRDFDPGHGAACATALTIPDGDSYLVKTWCERQRLTPFDETTVFGQYDFARDIEFLLEA